MLISIIVPTYNSIAFLEVTLNSINGQTYKDFEVLIADGGSKDETLQLVEKYPFARVVSFKDSGQTDGINRAKPFCKGDIIAWQNSDDTYEANCFQSVVDAFSSNREMDVVYGNYKLINKDNKVIKQCVSCKWNLYKFKTARFVPLQPTLFWRRKVSDDVFPLNVKLKYCMDVDFLAKAVNKGYNFLYINKTLGSFRIHSDGKTSKVSDVINILKEHYRVLKNNFRLGILDKAILYLRLTKLFTIKMIINIHNSK
jgi:glycosyltransferase involved in cell wall biosynthesis